MSLKGLRPSAVAKSRTTIGGFQFGKNSVSARHNARRQTRKLRNMHAIGTIRCALNHLMQKHNVAGVIGDFHGEIDETRQSLRQLRQFMKMRGENRPRPIGFMQMLNRRPGDRETIEGRRAATDFIENDERTRRRTIEDCRRLDHFDHEGRTPSREIVRSADA